MLRLARSSETADYFCSRHFTYFRLLSFLARFFPPKSPEVAGKTLLVEVSVVLPDAGLGFESSVEVEGFAVPDKGVVGVLRFFSRKESIVLGSVLNNPLYGGFVSAFPPPAG